MVPTDGLRLQVAFAVTFWVVPLLKVAVAVYVAVDPELTEDGPVTVTLDKLSVEVWATTVTVVLADLVTPPEV